MENFAASNDLFFIKPIPNICYLEYPKLHYLPFLSQQMIGKRILFYEHDCWPVHEGVKMICSNNTEEVSDCVRCISDELLVAQFVSSSHQRAAL